MAEHVKIDVSVVLPAYNEEENIRAVIEKTAAAFRDNDLLGEIVVVDDGSRDGTLAAAEAAQATFERVKVFSHRKNRGLTRALLTGFNAADGEVIIFLCADLQSDPEEDIPKLLAEIGRGNDVVLGWRQGRREMKIVVSKLYHWLSRLLFGIRAHDMNWIKAFRREVVADLQLRSDWHRYIAVLAQHEGYKISEVKTSYYPRQHGRSKFGTRRILAGFFDLIVVKFELSFGERPMFFFGALGLALLTAAGCIGVYGLTRWLIEDWVRGGDYRPMAVTYFSFISLLLAGGLLFAIGFLGEYLVSIRQSIRSLGMDTTTKREQGE